MTTTQHSFPQILPPFRPLPAHFTAQQTAFTHAVQDTHQHLFLRATAGSGKTNTLIEAAWHLSPQERACSFAYNRHSTLGVSARLPSHVHSVTPYTYGRGLLCRARHTTHLDMDAQKSSRLTQLLCTDDHGPFDPSLNSTLARRWNLAREAYQDHQASGDDLAILLTQIQWRNRPSLSFDLNVRLSEPTHTPRPALRAWAEDSLQLLSHCLTQTVRFNAALFRLAEEADQLARHPANHTSPFPVLVFLNAETYAVVRCDIDDTDPTCWRVTQPGPSRQFTP
ncbi:hypothetical protein [Deinococcus ruber]|uniref:Uncharacterized protein n=1 Tax=Deinococcus ruber TaxID=1848197 RepID=A0A918KXI0_9DEIO|nr:hypothetical protein [Deinococcus ruber]GGR40127.1 hypothetical protein GCM10008957_55870 [Deinococcus ruber]